jgi:hypothetical protein
MIFSSKTFLILKYQDIKSREVHWSSGECQELTA